jgi:hypothetical protein
MEAHISQRCGYAVGNLRLTCLTCMPTLYYVQYEARPLPENEDFSTVGGAYVNCYVVAKSGENASELAHKYLVEKFWEVVALEEGPVVRLREHYLDDPEMLECIDEALASGEFYVYHLWPIEPQDGDAIH